MKNKNKKLTNLEKKVLTAEAVFVLVSLIYIFFASAPQQLYPLNGMTISEPNFNIEIQNGQQVLISTNENFTNQIILGKDSDISLMPGVYYWKVRGNLRESEVKNFTIESNVNLEIREKENSSELANSGNVGLNVTKKKGSITSSIPLDVGETKNIENDNSTYEGRQA